MPSRPTTARGTCRSACPPPLPRAPRASSSTSILLEQLHHNHTRGRSRRSSRPVRRASSSSSPLSRVTRRGRTADRSISSSTPRAQTAVCLRPKSLGRTSTYLCLRCSACSSRLVWWMSCSGFRAKRRGMLMARWDIRGRLHGRRSGAYRLRPPGRVRARWCSSPSCCTSGQ